ncbi:MAG: response regulator transcription factor [Eubacterium sp.]|nr:response regulator transcription factor [Eubacterium sp.]
MVDIFICDDDDHVRSQIQAALECKILIEEYDMRIVCSTAKPDQLLACQEKTKRGIYFLDVELRDDKWDGFLLGKELRGRDPHGILVYITGYGSLAYRTFQYHLEAFDYMIKEPGRLEASISSCMESIYARLLAERKDPADLFTVQTGSTLHHIPLNEILFFETSSRPHHVLLHTINGRFDFLGSLGEIEETLGDRFLRVHRAYLVALDKIQEIDLKHNRLQVGGRYCLLSRRAKSVLLKQD